MLTVLFLFVTVLNAYKFVVDNRVEECVYADIKSTERVILDVDVLAGGNKDIVFKAKNPAGNEVLNQLIEDGKTTGAMNLRTADDGTYAFCFDNSMSLYTSKIVEFKISLPEVQAATSEEVNSIENKLKQVGNQLISARQDQKRFRNREARNRRTGDATNLRVTALFFGGCLVIMIMGVFQVWYIKRCFRRGK